MKRVIALLLSAALCFSALPVSALAVAGDSAENSETVQGSGQPEDKPQAGGDECSCEILCTAEAVNTDCPVCGADGADLTACKGAEAATPSDALESTEGQVQELINALPSLENLEAMTDEEQQTAYMEIQNAYEAYEALSDEEKTEIEGAEVFESLLGFFTSLPPVTHDNKNKNGTPVPGTEQLATNVNTDEENNPVVYYGEHGGSPIPWYVVGYNDVGMLGKGGINGNAPIATLLATGNIGELTKFYESGTGNRYNRSMLQDAVNDVADGFSDGERAAVTVRNLNDVSVNGALLWPLSIVEARGLETDILKLSTQSAPEGWAMFHWWLRSPGNTNTSAACVNGNGTVNYNGYYVTQSFGVRPAFNLDLNAVLFTSAAEGGKPDGGLQAIQSNTGNEWKLTLLDSSRNALTIMSVLRKGKEITVCYSGAAEGTGEYISAIIADNNGKYTHYGKLGEASAAGSASVTFTLPELEAGSKLYIFNEQCNGNKKTDYSSELIELAIPTGDTIKDGREVELRNNGTHIQWRYVGEGDDKWRDLVALDAITGGNSADGRDVELRVNGGYIQWRYTTGTDTDWKNLIALSALQGIKGDKGDKGDKGEPGENGSDGKDGQDGLTPYIGSNGNWWIGSTDTGIKATGINGADGSDGKDGQDGLTPYIGSNGNWWIGNTDTGIKAAGTNGANGRDGKDGKDGASGKDGVGVQSAAVNDEGELIITLTDGSVHNAGKVVGADGKDGAGISAMSIDDNGELIVTLTDGTELNAGAIPTAAAEDSGLKTIVYVSLGTAGVSLAGLLGLLAFLLTKRKMLIGK